MAAHQAILDFLIAFFAGVGEGHVESIVAVALIALILLRLVLPKAAFRFLVRSAVLGTIGVATWFGYQHAQVNFGQAVAIGIATVGGLFILVSMVMMASNSRQQAEGHQPYTEGDVVAGTGSASQAQGVPTTHPLFRSGSAGAGPAATPGHAQGGLLAQFRQLDPTERNNIFSVIAFMFIAEFGVFSSVTITAKDPVVGAIFFVVFHLAAILYIWTSYQDHKKGLTHYAVVAVASVVVALLLYYTWTVDPVAPAQLLPRNFFTEATMVASVTGVAFSLIISGKG